MFVSPAYAQTADGAGAGLMQILPLVLIFVVFYFLLIRPQQKRTKAHKEMLGALRRGDRIVTNGGVIGLVSKVADMEVTVEIADGVKVRVQRDMIATVKSKTEPASDEKKGDASGEASSKETIAGGLKKLLGGK